MKQKKTNIRIVSDLVLTDSQLSDFVNKFFEIIPGWIDK